MRYARNYSRVIMLNKTLVAEFGCRRSSTDRPTTGTLPMSNQVPLSLWVLCLYTTMTTTRGTTDRHYPGQLILYIFKSRNCLAGRSFYPCTSQTCYCSHHFLALGFPLLAVLDGASRILVVARYTKGTAFAKFRGQLLPKKEGLKLARPIGIHIVRQKRPE
jgi:hypothetical protein